MTEPNDYTIASGVPARKLWWDTRQYTMLRDDDRVRDCPGCGRLLLSAETDPERLRKCKVQLPPVACPKCDHNPQGEKCRKSR